MKLFILYIVLNLIYVCLTTAYSLVIQRCGKWTSAILSAITYGVYAIVLVYAVCPLPLWLKVITIACINFVSVTIVKAIQEKLKKDKLWRIDVRMPKCLLSKMESIGYDKVKWLKTADLKDEYAIVTFYCYTQTETKAVSADWVKKYDLKYCAIEGKEL